MQVIKQSHEILNKEESSIQILRDLERIGRTAYQSYDKTKYDSHEKFLKMIIKLGHESVIEHKIITVKAIVDRGISHEIVRHRIASYLQESTRYVNYNKKGGIEFILPTDFYPLLNLIVGIEQRDPNKPTKVRLEEAIKMGFQKLYWIDLTFEQRAELDGMIPNFTFWYNAMFDAEKAYSKMIDKGSKPQLARSVLPNSTKTEIILTLNLRSWRNFFKLRTAKGAHPDMKFFARNLLDDFKIYMPVIFDDINYK
jgi:thymidylate synthase (FAD)